ncbi:Translin [Blyttiomyces helicus]|uniref:Translin n=1 Tax=Blyttiomyces helicus TaxID=388810 RepID=A0A4P9W1A8_9FUNG|nr:Translin [Blyttiomyces helicus]|eukprot:RKO84933.1 Translin [Blyttiomyces helicus]
MSSEPTRPSKRPKTTDSPPSPSPIGSLFAEISTHLDEANVRRERIVVCSREITYQSKKMIFTLHRVNATNKEAVVQEAQKKQREIRSLFERAAKDLVGNDYFRYRRSISPGFEEYIEASSFLVFVEKGVLASKREIEDTLVADDGTQILRITDEDYLLGLADLTGEVMRYCINLVSRGQWENALGISGVEDV